MTEEEAKDSEEEGEDSKLGQSGGRNIQQSPLGSKFGHAGTHGLLKSVREASINLPDSTGPRVLPNVNNGEDSLAIPGNKRKSDQDSSFYNVDDSRIRYQTPDISKLPEKYTNITESKNADFPKALGCQDPGNTANTNSSVQQSGLHGSSMESKKLISELTSTSASAAGVAHSNEKLGATSYSRKNQREFSVPRILDGSSGIEGNKCENSKVDEAIGFMKSTSFEISGRGNDFTKEDEPFSLLSQKRINEASFTKLKSRKVSSDAKVSIQSANGKPQGLKVTSKVDGPPKAGSNSNSLAFDEHFSRNASPDSAQCDSVYQNSPQTAIRSLSESKISGKPDVTSSGMRQVGGNEAGLHITQSLDSSPKGNKISHNVESGGFTNLDLRNEECNKLVRKSPTKKSVVKGISGSKPRTGATATHKRSLSLNKTNLGEGVALCSESKEICDAKMHQGYHQNRDDNKKMEQDAVSKNTNDASDRAEFLTDETEAPDDKYEFEFGMALNEESVQASEKPNRATKEKSEAICPATKCEEENPPKKGTNKAETQKMSSLLVKNQARECAAGKANATVSKYAGDAGDRTETLDDETEDPDDKLKNELGMAPEEELVHPSKKRDKSTKVHPSRKRDKSLKEKPETIFPAPNCEEAMPPQGVTNKTEKQKPSSLLGKVQVRKRPPGKAKATVAKDLSKPKVVVSTEKIPNETRHEAEIDTVEEMPSSADKHDKSALARNKSETLAEEEKENRPIDLIQDPVKGRSNGNPTNKSNVRRTDIKSTKVGPIPSISESNTRVKTEAAYFILSGHNLQRKEFQQVLKRLSGRVCRHSHNWSYQATHFIAPDPLRRTEKFFAAAASGR